LSREGKLGYSNGRALLTVGQPLSLTKVWHSSVDVRVGLNCNTVAKLCLEKKTKRLLPPSGVKARHQLTISPLMVAGVGSAEAEISPPGIFLFSEREGVAGALLSSCNVSIPDCWANS